MDGETKDLKVHMNKTEVTISGKRCKWYRILGDGHVIQDGS